MLPSGLAHPALHLHLINAFEFCHHIIPATCTVLVRVIATLINVPNFQWCRYTLIRLPIRQIDCTLNKKFPNVYTWQHTNSALQKLNISSLSYCSSIFCCHCQSARNLVGILLHRRHRSSSILSPSSPSSPSPPSPPSSPSSFLTILSARLALSTFPVGLSRSSPSHPTLRHCLHSHSQRSTPRCASADQSSSLRCPLSTIRPRTSRCHWWSYQCRSSPSPGHTSHSSTSHYCPSLPVSCNQSTPSFFSSSLRTCTTRSIPWCCTCLSWFCFIMGLLFPFIPTSRCGHLSNHSECNRCTSTLGCCRWCTYICRYESNLGCQGSSPITNWCTRRTTSSICWIDGCSIHHCS